MKKVIVVGITGASGAAYARRLLQFFMNPDESPEEFEVHVSISPAGAEVIKQELDRRVDLENGDLAEFLETGENGGRSVDYHHYRDLMAPIASGSFRTHAMIICPCSGGTLGALVSGTSGNLIQRTADVHIKEGRKLILVPRETPLSLIYLENLRSACLAGATILPAMPGWYHGVRSIDDLIDFIVARILDQLEIDNRLMHRWGVEE